MMKKIFFIFGILAAVAIPAHWGHACQPCETILNFEESARASDLIIIGRKTGQYPPLGFMLKGSGPDWIRIEILETLKGASGQDIIKVNSFNGMCGYGIVIDDENEYIIFLSKSSVPDVDYDAVSDGCGIKTLPVTDKTVRYLDRDMPLNVFKAMLQPLLSITDEKLEEPSRPEAAGP